ncbi:MAG: hypothetical protein O3B87_04155 [bacterium]|nr:hypothetical protein [bacterium]
MVETQTEVPSKKVERFTHPRLQQSIFESYSPRNDATRLRELTHLTSAEQWYYIQENVMAYLEEFAGEIPLKQLSGIVRPDGSLEMCGANVTEMYRYSARLAGTDSREAAEAQGMDAILEGINKGANRAVWISPPKMADYGFAFTFVADTFDEKLGGIPVREFLPRYDENLNSVETSREIYRSIQEVVGIGKVHPDELQSYEDFLRNPLFDYSQHHEDLQFIYDKVGITAGDIAYSEQFRKEVLPRIKPWMDQYVQVIHKLTQKDLSDPSAFSPDILQLNERAEILIGAMFNVARAVQRQLKEDRSTILHANDNEILRLVNKPWFTENELFAAAHTAAQHESLVISGGSNCPVTQAAASEQGVLSFMRSGLSFIEAKHTFGLEENQSCGLQGCSATGAHFHCPTKKEGGCGGAIASGKGHEDCPHCGLNKNVYAEESGKRCD